MSLLSSVAQKLCRWEHGVFKRRTCAQLWTLLCSEILCCCSWTLGMSTLTRNYQNKIIHWAVIKFLGTGSVYDTQHSQCQNRRDRWCTLQLRRNSRSITVKIFKTATENWIISEKCSSNGQTAEITIILIFIRASVTTAARIQYCHFSYQFVCKGVHELKSFYPHPHEAIIHLTG